MRKVFRLEKIHNKYRMILCKMTLVENAAVGYYITVSTPVF